MHADAARLQSLRALGFGLHLEVPSVSDALIATCCFVLLLLASCELFAHPNHMIPTQTPTKNRVNGKACVMLERFVRRSMWLSRLCFAVFHIVHRTSHTSNSHTREPHTRRICCTADTIERQNYPPTGQATPRDDEVLLRYLTIANTPPRCPSLSWRWRSRASLEARGSWSTYTTRTQGWVLPSTCCWRPRLDHTWAQGTHTHKRPAPRTTLILVFTRGGVGVRASSNRVCGRAETCVDESSVFLFAH